MRAEANWNPEQEPQDAIAFMEQCALAGRIALAAIAVTATIGIVHTFSYADALTDEAVEKEARVARVLAEPRSEKVLLSLPLDCDGWIAQRGAGELWKVRCVKASTVRVSR